MVTKTVCGTVTVCRGPILVVCCWVTVTVEVGVAVFLVTTQLQAELMREGSHCPRSRLPRSRSSKPRLIYTVLCGATLVFVDVMVVSGANTVMTTWLVTWLVTSAVIVTVASGAVTTTCGLAVAVTVTVAGLV